MNPSRTSRWLGIFAIVVLFFTSLTVFAARPQWADPAFVPQQHESMYYAVAWGNLSQEDRAAVRNRALADIAGQIKVNISSVMNSVLKDTGSEVTEKTDYQVNAVTRARFFGQDVAIKEYVDNDNTYWVYAFMTKEDYQNRLAERLKQGKQNALLHLQSSQNLQQQGELFLAVKDYLKGLQALAPFRDLPLSASYQGRSISLWNALEQRFSGLVKGLHLQPLHSNINFSFQNDKTVVYTATWQNNGGAVPVNSLPVRFRVSRGMAEITEQSFTDSRGRVQCHIKSSRDASLAVTADVDWSTLATEPEVIDLAASYTAHLAGTEVAVQITGPVIFQTVSVSASSPELRNAAERSGILKSYLQNALKPVHATFSKDSQNSDLILNMPLNVKSLGNLLKQYNSDMVTVSVTAHVELLSPNTKAVVYSSPAVTVRNVGMTDVQAMTNALNKLTEEMQEKIQSKLIEQIKAQ